MACTGTPGDHPRYRPRPLEFVRWDAMTQVERAREFAEHLRRRRTVRHFSPEPVPPEVIAHAVAVAASAPSGANMQPWRFVVVTNKDVKRQIREAAEAEEREFYTHRISPDYRDALAPMGTNWHKDFLEVAPVLIVVFRVEYGVEQQADHETHVKHYYVMESVGIACGFLLAALHWSGLATLTHTPSPMGFLARILARPRNEKPYVLIPVGYPAAEAVVPDILKKPLSEVRIDVP